MPPYSFTRRSDLTDVIYAAHVNELQEAVEELGAIQRLVRTGDWYGPEPLIHGGYSFQALDANFIWFMPFWAGPDGVAVDRIAVFVQADAAGNARLGVYASHATTGLPDALIDDCGTVSVATTGTKSITISETYQGVSPGNVIWLAYVSDVAPTLISFAATTASSVLGGEATSLFAHQSAYVVAHAYAALPATVTPSARSIHCPAIYLRAA